VKPQVANDACVEKQDDAARSDSEDEDEDEDDDDEDSDSDDSDCEIIYHMSEKGESNLQKLSQVFTISDRILFHRCHRQSL
jgi:hypothetical protein